MSNYRVDRDPSYMKEQWGTTHLITDYIPVHSKEQKVIKEVVYDSENDYRETFESDLSYGLEPIYKIQKGQKVLSE